MIPFIPPTTSFAAADPTPAPVEPDFDKYPKRSICQHCDDPLQQAAPDGEWTFGGGRECAKAPNPDDGPMPSHKPGTILHPPKR
ncbi:hypothetical protein [Streptomyces albidoflavus]|uniref:hypothetical protein n=1 Tax=Streptomyces albidoflavus TaxID=1886 RepID=UPI00340E859A